MKKPKTDKILTDLKEQYEDYKDLVATWTTKRDQAIESLNYYSDLLVQTEDAINALEGKPTLKKMLEAALVSAKQADPLDPQLAPVSLPAPEGKNLPPAEPGFKWAVNDIGQDVLIPVGDSAPVVTETPAGRIVLPSVAEDTPFEDDPTELF